MTHIKKIVFAWAILLSTNSFAGGWTSGGGELIRDAHNPWFLSNTKEVKYCIQINEADFGQSKSFVRTQIFKAIDFWKMQLKELTYWNYADPAFDFHLGTQSFYEVDCREAHDLRFQFATLDKEQKQRLGDISKTIAVSVRTDYDLAKLKGKGFIFFNKNEQFTQKPWTEKDGNRVLPVLIHEMGHVFGIQHNTDTYVMKENFPEDVINGGIDNFNSTENQFNNYSDIHLFTYHESKFNFMLCSIVGPIQPIPKPKPISALQKSVKNQFFGQNEKDKCSGQFIEGQTFKFYSGERGSELLGEAQLRMQDLTDIANVFKSTELIHFWIPPEQKVFSNISQHMNSQKITIAVFQPKQFFKGTYKTLDGKIKRPIMLEVDNSGNITKISGYMNGEIYIDLQSGF